MPVREGIPLLGASHDDSGADVPPETMQWFLAEARDPTRGAWTLATRLPESGFDRVLDVGSGWGVNSLALAPHAGEVVAMDLDWHRLLAVKLLATARGFGNVTVLCGGDALPLPFPDDHFDAVAWIGLSERIPVGHRGDPRRHQLELLREIARVTRPGGEIFLAGENRYAHLTGPRFGSHHYPRLVRSEAYRPYRCSRRQYRRLLRRAGFAHTEFHGLSPAPRSYRKMFPLSRGRIVDPEERRGSALTDHLLGTRWAVRLAPAFGIRASDRPLGASWLQRLCTHLRSRPGLGGLEPEPYRLVTTNFCVKAAVRGGDGGGVLVRIPLTAPKQALVTHAVARQRRWRDHPLAGPLLGRRPSEVIEFEGWTMTLETLTPAPPDRPGARAPAWRQVADLLHTFATTRGRGSVRDALDVRLSPAFRDHLGEPHHAALETLFASTRLAEIPTCYQHGDFRWENLLCEGGTLVRVVGWEWATPDGIPLADFCDLVVSDGGVTFGARIVPALRDAAHERYPRQPLEPMATALREHHGLDSEDVRLLAVASVYDVLRRQWETTDSYGLGARFLPAPIRRVADQVPALARDLLPATQEV